MMTLGRRLVMNVTAPSRHVCEGCPSTESYDLLLSIDAYEGYTFLVGDELPLKHVLSQWFLPSIMAGSFFVV